MKVNIYPYQWELLAAMITFKVTQGLCIDYRRLGSKDYEQIHEDLPTISAWSIQKWFAGRKPASNALDDICNYLSSIFPYSKWEDFVEFESNLELLHLCQDWQTYIKLQKAQEPTKEYYKLQEIRLWVYKRLADIDKKRQVYSEWLNNDKVTENVLLRDYIGQYKYFMPGQIPPEKYKSIYLNPMEIFDDGEVWLQNAYNKKEFQGYATIKDSNTLQIILKPTILQQNADLEYVVFMRIDKYAHTAVYFPAVALGYDGQGEICAYPVLITSDLSLTIESNLVRLYFDYCYKNFEKEFRRGRMYCISPIVLQKLYFESQKLDKK